VSLRAGKSGVVELIVHQELRERLSKRQSSYLGAGTAPEEGIKCANQPPVSMKQNIRRGSVSG
jgi:hypothetical protein